MWIYTEVSEIDSSSKKWVSVPVPAVVWVTAGPVCEGCGCGVCSLGCVTVEIPQAPHCFAPVSATKGREAEAASRHSRSCADISQVT